MQTTQPRRNHLGDGRPDSSPVWQCLRLAFPYGVTYSAGGEMGAMRYLLTTAAILVTGLVGGILGWWAGLAMDRFRWLGLSPEEFWRTDPENVWVWGFIIGSVIGIAVALAVSAWWLSRTARTRRKVQDSKRQGV